MPTGRISEAVPAQEKIYFVVEAKLGPNDWQAINEVYPLAEQQPCYLTHEDANQAKSTLKSLLLGPWKGRFRKRPIRIREVDR